MIDQQVRERNMKLYSIFFAIFLATSAAPALAEELTIVGDHKAKPKNWLNDEQKPVGIMIDLLEEVGKRTGIKFTYALSPWKRAYVESEHGSGAIIGFSKTREREKLWHYSVPMYHDEIVFVTTKKSAFEFKGIDKLSGRTIAIKRGASYGDDFEKSRANGDFVAVEGTNRVSQLKMLLLGRVDAVLLSPGKIALAAVISKNRRLREHKDSFVVLSPPYKLDPNYLGIPKKMNKGHLLESINNALTKMMSDGTHKMIVDTNIKLVLSELN
ncbi:MAG: amino acid ABC transporter substrate-binding protein [Alphaproteobacteria bacterium]|jgi:ABC-type amino acid transport substrate-binding protein|nr:amino acid ABC transporter substrate-binding protein [Alphaproteobacteria bacterium]MBT5161928.1 amino acid ABC transporter substrate-binding protein [Alphaproteobacteria bacterium]